MEAKTEKKVTRTVYGHLIGSQAGNIDEFLLKAKTAMTVGKMAEKMNLSYPRVKSHINHLINAKGLSFATEGEGKETAYKLVVEAEKEG